MSTTGHAIESLTPTTGGRLIVDCAGCGEVGAVPAGPGEYGAAEALLAAHHASGPQRIQRRRTRGWRLPPGAVYVGRPGWYGNPFPADVEPFTRADAVRLYRDLILNGEAWLPDLVGTPHERRHRFTRWHGGFPVPTVESIRRDLAGRDLACWCPLTDPVGRPVPCHADVLLSLANHPGDLP